MTKTSLQFHWFDHPCPPPPPTPLPCPPPTPTLLKIFSKKICFARGRPNTNSLHSLPVPSRSAAQPGDEERNPSAVCCQRVVRVTWCCLPQLDWVASSPREHHPSLCTAHPRPLSCWALGYPQTSCDPRGIGKIPTGNEAK